MEAEAKALSQVLVKKLKEYVQPMNMLSIMTDEEATGHSMELAM